MTLLDRLILRKQKLRMQNAQNTMAYKNYHFQPPVAIETTGVYGKSTAPFLSGLAKKLVDVSGDSMERHPVAPPAPVPGCDQRRCYHQYIGLCLVCKFDLISSVLFLVAFNLLTSIAACHLPLHQCIAIAFLILILSVAFIVPSVVQCYLVHRLTILSITWPIMGIQHGEMFHIA